MKCLVCGNEVKAQRCPVCGFPVFHVVAGKNTPEDDATMQKMVAEYRKKKLSGISVGIHVYSYRMRESSLELSEESEIELASSFEQLSAGDIIWYKESFAWIEDDTLELTTVIRRAEGVAQKKVLVKAPKGDGLWKVGVRMEEGLSFCILVGNPREYESSGEISLLETVAS
ncbi:MAG: hypothetical protein LUC98_01845 [Lachnospiraceae bacterium]|nr:hypothetical protein [Lachnospiraceae bacterium]